LLAFAETCVVFLLLQ